ncbi:MAG TPA: NAD(P)/FAD-dependent oxidoreductase [Acidimicrobiales bacterium]|nr:NAD(P)/FAD-dependent oxidoreductase [Acidimicrobiales bacterium]
MRQLRCAVIGAGMAGILSTIKLREAGIDDVTIYEKGDAFGGTWRENTYPGLSCDVPSHLYSFSFQPNTEWSHRFSPGPEIRAYFEDVATRHGLHADTRFGEEVTSCQFVEGRWHLETSSGTHDVVDVVIAATGVLHHPNVPTLEGLETFGGRSFHSARWDHDVEIDGRRVGVIGTGSTAVQITGAIVDRVSSFTLFQRTAQWILPLQNPPYTEDERAKFRQDQALMAQTRREFAQVFTEGFADALVNAESPEMQMLEDMCRDNLEKSVTDPVLRERLRPTYRAACKRLVLSENFYDAIQRPNAHLATAPIDRVEPRGIRTTDGALHELDVIVLATGFKVDRFVRPTKVLGEGGLDLDEVWSDGPIAYLSISVPGFPNFFMLNGPNGPVGNFSLIEVAELQMAYIMALIGALRSGEATQVSAGEEATKRLEAERRAAAGSTIWMTGCRSWYLDRHGVPATWPWGFTRFREAMTSPDWGDFDLVGPVATALT